MNSSSRKICEKRFPMAFGDVTWRRPQQLAQTVPPPDGRLCYPVAAIMSVDTLYMAPAPTMVLGRSVEGQEAEIEQVDF